MIKVRGVSGYLWGCSWERAERLEKFCIVICLGVDISVYTCGSSSGYTLKIRALSYKHVMFSHKKKKFQSQKKKRMSQHIVLLRRRLVRVGWAAGAQDGTGARALGTENKALATGH